MHAINIGPAPPAAAIAETSRTIWVIACVAALGGLLFGYDWVVIGGAKPFYEARLGIERPTSQAWAVSCALIGCLVGAAMSGRISDLLGRRPALLVAATLFAVSAVGTALVDSFNGFVIWRIVGGLAVGMASGLSPLYIAEIAPAQSRGRLVVLNQMAIMAGLLGAQVVNWLIARPVPSGATMAEIALSWNGTEGWRWMFGAAAVPAVFFMIGSFLIPESPRWLAQQGRWQESRRVLERLGGDQFAEIALADMRAALAAAPGRSLSAVLGDFRFRGVMLLGVGIAVLQQWCGINVVFNYAQEIFAAAGYTVSDTLFNIVITGIVNVVFTSIAFMTIERLGRRRLMLTGCGGLAAIYTILGGFYLAGIQGWPLLLLVIGAIACYALTLAPVTWVILAEIFPSEARGACMAIATTALWAACFVLTYTFPLLNDWAGTGLTFWLYAAVCGIGLIFIKAKLPETKGLSLESIERSWT